MDQAVEEDVEGVPEAKELPEEVMDLVVVQDLNSFVFKFVVKFLNLKEKAKCQLVCHQWKDIVDDEFRVYQYALSSWKNDNPNQHHKYKHSPFSSIGPAIDTEDYNKLDAILTRFPNLRCVYLNNEPDEIMQDFFKYKCPKISHIYLDKTKRIRAFNKDNLIIYMRMRKGLRVERKFPNYEFDDTEVPFGLRIKKMIINYQTNYDVKIIELKHRQPIQ